MTDERYVFTNKWTMQREESHPFYWLLHNQVGVRMDRDKYRHDLMDRHGLKVEREEPVK